MTKFLRGLQQVGRHYRCLQKLQPSTANVHKYCNRWMSSGDNASSLQVVIDDKTGIGTMTLSKPPVNSLNLEFLTELYIALEKLENDKACKGLIITSSVPKIFSAGLDIMEMYQPNIDRLQEFWRTLQEMWLRLYGSGLPTIAAVNGHSPAGGCLISSSCDYRFMAPGYTIGLNETQLGIVAPFWFQDTMLAVIGQRHTERALQLGLLYSTQEAKDVGLIDEIVPQDQILEAAQTEMKKWLKIPGVARQLSKSMMRGPVIEKLNNKREEDIKNFVDYCTRDSIQKYLGMYLESLKKRKK